MIPIFIPAGGGGSPKFKEIVIIIICCFYFFYILTTFFDFLLGHYEYKSDLLIDLLIPFKTWAIALYEKWMALK